MRATGVVVQEMDFERSREMNGLSASQICFSVVFTGEDDCKAVGGREGGRPVQCWGARGEEGSRGSLHRET